MLSSKQPQMWDTDTVDGQNEKKQFVTLSRLYDYLRFRNCFSRSMSSGSEKEIRDL